MLTSTQGVAPTDTRPSADRNRLAVAGTLLAAAVIASLIDAVIAAIAHAAGASNEFRPLMAPAFIAFTLIGILAGAAGWTLVRRRARHPKTLLARLVPIVLGLSFLPDLAMLVSNYEPHANAAGVVGLLAMHASVAAVAVISYRRALPVSDSRA